VQPRRQAVITRKWSPEAKNVVAEKAANGRRDGLLILLLETWVNPSCWHFTHVASCAR
jgi:hypothetical protein